MSRSQLLYHFPLFPAKGSKNTVLFSARATNFAVNARQGIIGHMAPRQELTFELYRTELADLASDDPLRPAAVVHVTGRDARQCYDAVKETVTLFRVGRGDIPGGYFFVATAADYPALREVLYPFWPDMPAAIPNIPAPFGATYSQEMSDVMNLLRFEPRPDPAFRRELHERLPGLVPRQRERQMILALTWLREHVFSINNCFMLSAIVTRCLCHAGGHAVYCSGRVTLQTSSGPARIGHAWVEIGEGEKPAIIDMTIDMQSAWGEAKSDDIAHIRPGDVQDERIHYEGQRADLDAVWRQYTPPSEGNPYTRASQRQQQHMARQVVARQNRAWAMFVLEYGLWNGTYRLLQDMIDAPVGNQQKRKRRR